MSGLSFIPNGTLLSVSQPTAGGGTLYSINTTTGAATVVGNTGLPTGTTAGFLEYGFYGTDLSNRVRYIGVKGPHGAFNAIPNCSEFRAAVNAADLDYLVTSPFLNFIEPGKPIASPEARWLRGEPAVAPIQRSGPVTRRAYGSSSSLLGLKRWPWSGA